MGTLSPIRDLKLQIRDNILREGSPPPTCHLSPLFIFLLQIVSLVYVFVLYLL